MTTPKEMTATSAADSGTEKKLGNTLIVISPKPKPVIPMAKDARVATDAMMINSDADTAQHKPIPELLSTQSSAVPDAVEHDRAAKRPSGPLHPSRRRVVPGRAVRVTSGAHIGYLSHAEPSMRITTDHDLGEG